MIEPTHDAGFVNSVINHPAVRPWVADMGEGFIDLTDRIEQDQLIALRGDHGVFILFRYGPGIYEVHTAIVPAGRGEWGRKFCLDGAWFMFTGTDCVEILTRVPKPHDAARRLTLGMGFRLQFETLPETKFRGEMVPIEVYSLSIQDWANSAPTEKAGAMFHDWLNKKVLTYSDSQIPHPNDPAHNRVVGVSLVMIQNGSVAKGIDWYNRWALAARHPLIALVDTNPVRVAFDAGILTMGENGVIEYAPKQ